MNALSSKDEKTLALLSQSGRARSELIEEMQRAISDGRREFANSIRDILEERHPGWDQTASHVQNSSATSAMFCGAVRRFDTPTAAYVWLVENLIDRLPAQLDKLYDEPDFSRTVVRGGRGAIYLARSPQDLFPNDPERASKRSNFTKMRNGWYLSLNLSTKQKNDRLYAFACYGRLKVNQDWSWSADESPDLEQLLCGLLPRNL